MNQTNQSAVDPFIDQFAQHRRELLQKPMGGFKLRSEVGKPKIGYAVFDLETTGFDSKKERIIQIAISLTDPDGKITGSWQSLINPMRVVSPEILELTGIKEEDLVGKPAFESVADKVFEMLDGRILVAHNMNFDLPFMQAAYNRMDKIFAPHGKACTLQAQRFLHPGMPTKLEACVTRLGHKIDGVQFHNALYDTKMTHLLLMDLIKRDIAPETLWLDEDAYFRHCSLGNRERPSESQYKRLYKQARNAGLLNSEERVDREKLRQLSLRLTGRDLDLLDRERLQVLFDALAWMQTDKAPKYALK